MVPIVQSTMLMKLGDKMPDFSLPDIHNVSIIEADYLDTASAAMVVFIGNQCPYVKHIEQGISDFAREYTARNLITIGICSSEQSQNSKDNSSGLIEQSQRANFSFVYLVDASQDTAKAFSAACTPDFFLFDEDLRLAYRGQFDGSRPDNGIPVTGSDLRIAASAVLEGGTGVMDPMPSTGCSVGWSTGNEPAYYSG